MSTLPHGTASGPRSPFPRLPAVLVFGALLTEPGVSAAEAPPDPYTELLRQADKALHSNHPQEAINAWRAAWTLKQSALVACNIGRAELLYRSAREGAEFLSTCLRMSPAVPDTPQEAERRAHFAADFEEARKRVSELTITTSENGATVHVDDRLVGVTPLQGKVFVEPGSHTVSVELAGYEKGSADARVSRGEARSLFITLVKSKAPPRPAPPLSPVAQIQTLAMPVDPPGPSPAWAWGGGSFAAAGFALGAVFLAARDSAERDALDYRQEVKALLAMDCTPTSIQKACEKYKDAEQSRVAFGVASTVSFVSAGVLAVATVAYVLMPRSPVMPLVGKTNGLTVLF